jgi:hypothetical protein
MNRLYIEGNNGGDYLQIEPLDDNLMRLEVGHQCARNIEHVVPVEFVTAVLTAAVLEHDGIEGAIMALDWPQEFKEKLATQVKSEWGEP